VASAPGLEFLSATKRTARSYKKHMDTLWRDVCFGLRLLSKNKGFAAVAVLALALGIGPNTATFSVIYATLLAPMPYPQPDQLVVVWSKIQGSRNVVSAGPLRWPSEPMKSGCAWRWARAGREFSDSFCAKA